MHMESNCCGAATTGCDSAIAELPRYYPRQLITPDDLTLEQNYFRDRMRRHNRLLHGSGVVCGALVCPVPNPHPTDSGGLFLPWQVQVEKGYVLGPYGDEIILDCPRKVDLRTNGVEGVTGEPCIDAPDPWCTQVFVNPTDTTTFYIAVKYKQAMARPVRVQPAGCGCDDTSCEYSRWKDGYEIGVLRDWQPCPQSPRGYDNSTPPKVDLTLLAKGDDPACPDCSCGPWVCLATVTVDVNGVVQTIDNCGCRRLVMSFSQFWWTCTSTPAEVTGATPQPLHTGTNVLTVTGENFRCGIKATFDKGLTVQDVIVRDPQILVLTVTVPAGVTSPATLTVANLDGTPASSVPVNVDATAPAGGGGGGGPLHMGVTGSAAPHAKGNRQGTRPKRTVKRTP